MKLSTIISPNFDTIVRNATKTLDANFNNYVDLDKHSLVDINWINELTTLNNIYTAFGNDAGESSLADMGERVAGSKDQAAIADLLHNVNNSTLLREMLPQMIHESLEVSNLTSWEKEWFTDQIDGEMADKDEWAIEIVNLSSLLAKTADFDLNNFDMEDSEDEDIDKLGLILRDMNYSRIFDINNLPSILEVDDPESILAGADFTNLPADTAAWDDEITTLVKALKELKAIKPVGIEKHEEVGTLLNTIQDSVILGYNIDLIVENSLEQLNDKFMGYVDLDNIDTLSVDWVLELGVLNTLYNDFGDFTGADFKLSSLKGDKIENIMLTASTGEVATQIFGKLYNEQLQTVLGEHNPRDDHGELLYDYTDQAVLRDNAFNVGKLIDFGNETRALFLSPDDKEQGLVVGNYIKSYNAALGDPNRDFADAYFPAIIAYANGIDKPSPLEGLDMSTVNYEVEGQLFIDFYEAESAYDKALVLDEINTTSTLTKAILSTLLEDN